MLKSYFVYITVDLKNANFYLGRHYGFLDVAKDQYYGSSDAIKNIKRKRKHTLRRVIIQCFPDIASCVEGEKFWGEAFDVVNDKRFYNRNTCGHGSFAHLHDKQKGENHPRFGAVISAATRKAISESNKGKPKWNDEDKKRMSEQRAGNKHWRYGKRVSEESKDKARETLKQFRANKIAEDPNWKLPHKSKKRVFTVKDPCGTIHIVNGLTPFAKKNGFHAPGMYTNGKSNGWILIEIHDCFVIE